jgi:secreted PhoX family phosphatase
VDDVVLPPGFVYDEVHPADGSVFIAFTSSSDRPGLWPNVHGEVWRLEEDGGDHTARTFRWSRFSVGGPPDAARTGHVFTQRRTTS